MTSSDPTRETMKELRMTRPKGMVVRAEE
jgi:hypothetical protein